MRFPVKPILLVLILISLFAAAAWGLLERNTHAYAAERICYGPYPGECGEMLMSGEVTLPAGGFVLAGYLTTVADVPVMWRIIIGKQRGDAAKPIETLSFYPFLQTRASKTLGRISASITGVDSVAYMGVILRDASIQSKIHMRKLW